MPSTSEELSEDIDDGEDSDFYCQKPVKSKRYIHTYNLTQW